MVRMKKVSTTIMFFVLMLAVGFLQPVFAGDDTVINEDINKAAGSLEIPRNTTVNGNVTLNLGELNIFGVVNGNVYSNIGQVIIAGDVNGNVEANMGQVIIDGNVGGDVKARMGEVTVDGSVGGNLIADLGAANVEGTVGGNIDSGFGELRINGTVAGNVNSKGGTVIINGIVQGDVILDQGVVELGPEAVVTGKIYVGKGIIRKAETAIVGSVEITEELPVSELQENANSDGYRFNGLNGNFVENIIEEVTGAIDRSFRDARFMPHMSRTRHWPFFQFPFMGSYGNVARGVINMLIMFALAALTYTLFPLQVKAAGYAVSVKTGPVIGWGILAAVMAIPLMILLAITVIGIPLIFVEIIFLAVAVILGYTGIAHLVGNRVINAASSNPANPLAAIALGVLLIGLISMIPLLGFLVSLAVYILAIGAALATGFGRIKPPDRVPELQQ